MADWSLELLTHRSLPDLARAVREVKYQVVTAWVDIAGKALPPAAPLSHEQLRDNFIDVLEQLAELLASDHPDSLQPLLSGSATHGDSRFSQGYSLANLMVEYAIARAILIRLVSAHLGRPLNDVEAIALNRGYDLSVRQGVLSFFQLERAKVQSAADARSRFLSFLSHDLRGGLNSVLLMVEVLKQELAGEEQFGESLQDLDRMRRSILETVATMERFLQSERLSSGKVQLKVGHVQLHAVVDDVVQQFTAQAQRKGLELRVDVHDHPAVESDRQLLTLILHNLVSNAVKYTEKGAIFISADPVDGDAWQLAVADQGPGIDAEFLDQLFAPYARGDTPQKGVGLGLSIAKQSADLLGARLWAESVQGQGTRFFLKIPLSPPAAPVNVGPDEA